MSRRDDFDDDFEDFMLFRMITGNGGGCLTSIIATVGVISVVIMLIV